MSGFFALLDDIASLMDDVSVMAKVAGKKTAGILGDDLAVGADQASRFRASRELPVLRKITKGSFINKLIILPFAFLLSAFLPQVIVPILLIGGIYLCYEGVEKIIHTFFHKRQHDISEIIENEADEELLLVENKKIKSTILTDFILSIEIIMIALGTVTEETLGMQIIVVSIIAIVSTIGVYGIVALMVRMDDVGFRLIRITKTKNKIINKIYASIGKALIWTLPKLIQLLAIIGTIAMLLVGGGMYVHNIPEIHDFFQALPSIISELVVGLIVGLIAFSLMVGFQKIKKYFFK